MKSHPRTVRVLIVDGEPLTREGIAVCIRRMPGHHVCGLAGDAPTARRLCAEKKPDLIVLVLPVPGGGGFGLVRELSRLHPPARTVVIGAHDDPRTVESVFRAGAQGFVRRVDELADLRDACAAVLRGKRFVSLHAEQSILGGFARGARKAAVADSAVFSEREMAIFSLLGKGMGPKAIARELGSSVRTVETHQRRIKEKLGACTAAEVRQRAARWMARHDGQRDGAERGV